MESVRVVVRVRPLCEMARSRSCLRVSGGGTQLYCGPDPTPFIFDTVFDEGSQQEDMFQECGVPIIENCMEGYNCSVFTYGQTGSGKTHTMWGSLPGFDEELSEQAGLIPRTVVALLSTMAAEKEMGTSVALDCSMVEIYNETICDLLNPASGNLALREGKDGAYIEHVYTRRVRTVDDVFDLIHEGHMNRSIGETQMNRNSSRSHCVLTFTIKKTVQDHSGTKTVVSRLHMIDLAGSERQKLAGTVGERLKEACGINKSLSTLGHVIMSLADQDLGMQRHVPYRDSKLTFLLQDSLGGNSKTIMIANVTPCIKSLEETLSTLRFARGAKRIKNKAYVNEALSTDIEYLQNEVLKLRAELQDARSCQEDSNSRTPFANVTGEVNNTDENRFRGDPYVLELQEELRAARSAAAMWETRVHQTRAATRSAVEDMVRMGANLAAKSFECESLEEQKAFQRRHYESVIALYEQRVSQPESAKERSSDVSTNTQVVSPHTPPLEIEEHKDKDAKEEDGDQAPGNARYASSACSWSPTPTAERSSSRSNRFNIFGNLPRGVYGFAVEFILFAVSAAILCVLSTTVMDTSLNN